MDLNGKSEVNIPVVDISSPNASASSQLLDAATKYGFVFIENNEAEIVSNKISELFDLSRRFFASPVAEKEEVAIASNKAGKNHGFLGRGIEKLDPATQKRPDVKEAFNIGEHLDGKLQQPMPKSLQLHINTIIECQDACHNFCLKIFELFAQALDIKRDWFTSRHDQTKGSSGTVLRMLYYPKTDDVEEGVDIRAGAHTDFGSITLLFQQLGQPGLEIQTPSGGWAAVPVNPRIDRNEHRSTEGALPILINFGDLLEDWTGGVIRSTVHRVVFPQGEQNDRYSIAYFCHPLDDSKLEPVPSKLIQDHVSKTGKGMTRNGKVLTAKDHLMERLAATYSIGQKTAIELIT